MKISRTRQIVAAALTVVTLGAGTYVAAQSNGDQTGSQGSQAATQRPGKGGWGHHGGRRGGRGGFGGDFGLAGPLMRQLDVTDAQREQIRGIVGQHKDEFKAIGERVGAARKSQVDAILAVPSDEQSIRAKTTELASAEADAAVLRSRVHAEVFNVLTPEQQEKAKALREQMTQRRSEMRQKFQERRQQRQQQKSQAQPPAAL
jgi:protein CpxP